MNFQKNTIRTTFLTITTITLVVLTLLIVGVPGFLNQQYTVFVYFDNASGIQQGANVMVSGRKIGFVDSIESPLPPDERPKGHPDLDVRIGVKIKASNKIYKDSQAMMMQQGLLGSMVIDFVKGSPDDGFAEPGASYIGQRRPDFTEAIPELLNAIEPVAKSAEDTLSELKVAAERLEFILGEGGPLAEALYQIRDLANNLGDITAKDGTLTVTLKEFGDFARELSDKEGSLQETLRNLREFTNQLSEGDKVGTTLDSIRDAAEKLDQSLGKVDVLVGSVEPELQKTLMNTEQMTDTLKRQPWRLIWPSTKEYAEDDDPEVRKAIIVRPTPRGPLK